MKAEAVRRVVPVMAMVAAAWLLAAAASAFAGTPDEDHRKGLTAYHRGDVVGAMAALRGPAKAGHAPSQALLGFILERADFVEEAAQLFTSAAAQDDPDGHAGLASLLLAGRGVAKDEKAALRHFSKAAALGHAASIDLVASAWIDGRWGADPVADPATALAVIRRAADRGDLRAVDALAQAYSTGRYGLPVDTAQVVQWQMRYAALKRERATVTAKAK